MYKLLQLLLFSIAFSGDAAALHYWQEYGPAQVIPHERIYADLNQGAKFDSSLVRGEIKVVVTSTNKTKVKACEKIFQNNSRLSNANISLLSYKSNSGIAEQPLGLDAAERGAVNRILSVKKDNPQLSVETDIYYCSIENYFTRPDIYEPRDHAFVLIEDPIGKTYRYVSDGVEIEPTIYNVALEAEGLSLDGSGAKKTIGAVLAERYQVDPQNWHQYVTQDKVSRYDQIVSAFDNVRYF